MAAFQIFMSKPIFIAEIKTKSPFGFKSKNSFMELMEYACEYGDWVSVHTNSLWGGDFAHIEFVRSFTSKPILAKGLHTTADSVLKAFEAGANFVLTTNSHLGTAASPRNDWFKLDAYKDRILFETEASKAKCDIDFNSFFKSRRYVANSRDLKTGKTKGYRELDEFLNLGVWVCQASNIMTPKDVDKRANAFIVGQNLPDFCIESLHPENS